MVRPLQCDSLFRMPKGASYQFMLCVVCSLIYACISLLTLYCKVHRLEPNMLKNLPIIPSRTSQNFYLLFLFYSQVPPIIPYLFYCVNDIIKIQDWLYIIYIVTDCFNTIFDCTIRVCRSLQTSWQGTASIWEGLGSARHAFLLCHCLKLIYLVFHMFQLPIILILCLCTAYNSGIILVKIVTYYS